MAQFPSYTTRSSHLFSYTHSASVTGGISGPLKSPSAQICRKGLHGAMRLCVRVSQELVNSGHQGPGESVQGWWHRAVSTSGSIIWTIFRETVDCSIQSKTTGLYVHLLTQGTPNKFLNAPVVSGPPPTSMQAYSGFGLLMLFLPYLGVNCAKKWTQRGNSYFYP